MQTHESDIANPKSKILSLVFALTVAILVSTHRADAQQSAKIPRIGYVSESGDANNPGPTVDAFRRGLRDFGYIEGKNILVEHRYAGGKLERVPGFVTELVQLKVDILVVVSTTAIRAAKQATNTISIVRVTTQDL